MFEFHASELECAVRGLYLGGGDELNSVMDYGASWTLENIEPGDFVEFGYGDQYEDSY